MRQSIDRVIRLTGVCLLVAASARAQNSFAVLKDFDSPLSQIQGGILRTADGTLYGSTINGGPDQHGGIFRVQADGSGFTVLHRFQFSDGYSSFAELTLGADGLLYGTTQSGGQGGVGTIFKLQTDGSSYAVIHSFDGVSGSFPRGGLTQSADGTLYGTTEVGLAGETARSSRSSPTVPDSRSFTPSGGWTEASEGDTDAGGRQDLRRHFSRWHREPGDQSSGSRPTGPGSLPFTPSAKPRAPTRARHWQSVPMAPFTELPVREAPRATGRSSRSRRTGLASPS